ncbi:MAG: FecR domain-containing protein [Spirochaetes bacterium]|nr:FecR domain-containing protein [Spirochaetota bacterium]
MKKIIIILLIIFITYTLNAQITIKSIIGFVQFKKDINSEWIIPKVGDKLQPGYIIYTGFKSTAVIQTPNAVIEVKPLSQITISSLLVSQDKISTDIYLKYGKVRAEVNVNKQTQTLFKVRSANSTASVRGTIFEFGDKELLVDEGTVYLLSDSNFSALVEKNETAVISTFGDITSPADNKVVSAAVNTNPLGTSQGEGDFSDVLGINSIKSEAKIIIRIYVKK